MGAIRRATGTTINHFEKMTKGLLIYILEQHGATFEVRKLVTDKFTGREFFVHYDKDGIESHFRCDVVAKGETPDWQAMYDDIQRTLLFLKLERMR